MRDNLRTRVYKSILAFAEDVRLTFRNALTYNPPGHHIHDMAGTCSSSSSSSNASMPPTLTHLLTHPHSLSPTYYILTLTHLSSLTLTPTQPRTILDYLQNRC